MTLLHTFECGPVATFAYLLCTPELGTAVLIDAPYGSVDLVCEEAERAGCRITDLLLTHTHWDHTADAAELVRRTGARVHVHAADAYRLTDPMAHTVWPLPFTIGAVRPDAYVDQGAVMDVAGLRLRVLHTPGHTEGGVCFVDDANQRVFAGDTLFAGSVGRVDLPGGNEDQLIASIRTQLFALPEEMVVWPGHGPSTTIGQERRHNPFVGEGVW